MRSPLLVSLLAAARVGAEILVDRFSRLSELVVTEKGPSDFVSAADMASEAAIKRALAAAHPGARFQAEETTENRVSQGDRFIIDPLDGTTNCLHAFLTSRSRSRSGTTRAPSPASCSIRAATRPSSPSVGAGAYLETRAGERRLNGSRHGELTDAVIHSGVPHRGRSDHEHYLVQIERVMRQVVGVRRLGAAALDFAYVAAGRGEGFFEKGLQPWDMAAGMLLVREAGGLVTDFSGKDDMMRTTEIVAGMPAIHAALLDCVGTR